MEEKQKKKLKRERRAFLARLAIYAAIFAAAVACLRFRVMHVNNMFPTIRDGELAIFTPFKKPVLDTIILYEAGGETHVGRVKGQPGDMVEVQGGSLLVNGNVIYESLPYDTPEGDAEYPVSVGNDEVFVLSDYREITDDSRTFGCIPLEDVEGTLLFTMRYRGF